MKKCERCGKEFEGNALMCTECEVSSQDINSVEDVKVNEESVVSDNENEETAEILENTGTDEANNTAIQNIFSQKKKITVLALVVIVLVMLFSLLTPSPTTKIMNSIEKGEIEKANDIYSELDTKEISKVNEKIIRECEFLIDKYNEEDKTYEEVSGRIDSFSSVVSRADVCKKQLNKLYDSKTAFSKGKEYVKKSEWANAKTEFEKVIENDSKHSEALSEIENCNKNIALTHFKNGLQFEEEEKWVEAIEEYEKVTEIIPDEAAQATENKAKCIEKLRSSVNPKLEQMYNEGKYEEGLKVIETAEKYIKDDTTLQNHKTKFTEKKQEQDRIREENKYNTGITYDQLARYPDDYEGKYVKFTGKVLQVQSSSYYTVYRIGTAGYGYYDNVIYVTQLDTNTKNRILEDDIVTIKGKSTGLYTYETVMGNSITIPSIMLDSIER